MKDVSALMDGELEDGEAFTVIAQLKSRDELRADWAVYHAVGDALRGEASLSANFPEKFRQRLAQEPTVLAPRRHFTEKVRVYALSAAASVAAIAAVGWMTLFQNPLSPPAETIASVAPSTASGIMPAAMNDYLWAHEENSPVGVRPIPDVRALPVAAPTEVAATQAAR